MTQGRNPFDEAPAHTDTDIFGPPSGDGTPPKRELKPPHVPDALKARTPSSEPAVGPVPPPAPEPSDSVVVAGRGTLRPLAEIIIDLSQILPAQDLRFKKRGGSEIPFIPQYKAQQLMDRYAPGWQYEITSVSTTPDAAIVSVRVWILSIEGWTCRDAMAMESFLETVKDRDTGEMVERPISYGDAATNAEAQAMKRAFRKFGLGLFLTLKDTDDNMLDREKAEKWHAWYANQLRGKNGGANPAGGA
ncbi:MAG TPA: Rad52/Rad22 family DNA repair protein [Candidatus Krumholzibacteria bacterium]|nr:Rad52/Rad22 family DNA repair protein [Candidatus Krumholzibacteria bacterium]